jgi:hypothetical protein
VRELLLTKLSGVTYDGRQQAIRRLNRNSIIALKRDHGNRHDSHAIGVWTDSGESIGWIPREYAALLAPLMDAGDRFHATVGKVIGGQGMNYGVLIRIEQQNSGDSLKVPVNLGRVGLSNFEKKELDRLAMECYNSLVSGTNPTIGASRELGLIMVGSIQGDSFRFSVQRVEQSLYACIFDMNLGYHHMIDPGQGVRDLEIARYVDDYLCGVFTQLMEYIEEQLYRQTAGGHDE